MDLTGTFILYLTIHRILVFAAGILSITLGYRLLMRGLPGKSGGGSGESQSLEAAVGKAKLSAKNLAPGSLFALFGAVMIAGMALYRPPEITLDQIEKGGARTHTSFRGDEPAQPEGSAAEALRLLQAGSQAAAAKMAAQVGQSSAAQWNNLAWVIASTAGDTEIALALARAAVAAAPDSAEYLHTLATVQRSRGDSQAALRNIRKAAEIDPRFAAMMKQWEASPRGR